MKIKVGIFLGGSSRHREASFVSGRAYFMHLDRGIFEPVLYFVNSRNQILSLHWKYLFQPDLISFYPPTAVLPPSRHQLPIYEESLGNLAAEEYDQITTHIGKQIPLETLAQAIDLACIALEESDSSTGQLQLNLEALRIPYSGNRSLVCKTLNDPQLQAHILQEHDIPTPASFLLRPEEWVASSAATLFSEAGQRLGFPFHLYPASDPGKAVSIDAESTLEAFRETVEAAFFQESIPISRWQAMGNYDRLDHIRFLTDLRNGLGFPVHALVGHTRAYITHPEELFRYLNQLAADPNSEREVCWLSSALPTDPVVFASKKMGEYFSVVVTRDTAYTLQALPPRKYAYKGTRSDSGYPSAATDVEFEAIQAAQIQEISKAVCQAFDCQGYAVVYGLIDIKGVILIERVQALGAFSPESPLFLAGSQMGLTPSAWLTQLLYTALLERLQDQPAAPRYLQLRSQFDTLRKQLPPKKRVGILYMESNTAPKQVDSVAETMQYLGASGHFTPLPIQVVLNDQEIRLHPQPPLHFWGGKPSETAISLAELPNLVDLIVIDYLIGSGIGSLLQTLERLQLPFTGPLAGSASIATHRRQSLDVLRQNARLTVSEYLHLPRQAFEADPSGFFARVESRFSYPFLGSTLDATKEESAILLHNRSALDAFVRLTFRPPELEGAAFRRILRLKPNQHVPPSAHVFFQEILSSPGARYTLPVSVATLSLYDEAGNMRYQAFEAVLRQTPWYPAPAVLPDKTIKWAGIAQQAAEKASRQLDLYGVALIHLVIRIFDTGHIEPVIEYIQPYPSWERSGLLVHQLVLQDIYPGILWHDLLQNSILREHWKPLQKAAQAAHLVAWHTPYVTTPEQVDLSAPEPEITTTDMESSTPPSKFSRLRPNLPATGIIAIVQDALWELWYFFTSAIFLKNLVALVVFTVGLYGLMTLGLMLYTNHGQSVEVTDYRGMSVREATRKARARSFDLIVNDSNYIVGKAHNMILDQTPKPSSRIKKNRNIYLTISSNTPPQVPLPNLIGGNDDFDQYKKKLDRLGIKARIRDQEFNAELEENTILYLVFEGRRISAADLKRGVEVPKGSTVDFIVSIRNTGTVDIPSLVCLTYEEAAFLLRSSQLAIGSVFAPGEVSPGLFVYKQEPEFSLAVKLNIGEQVNLYLTETRPEGCGEQ